MEIKLEAKLTQQDICTAVGEYLERHHPDMKVTETRLSITRGYSDMRESSPDVVNSVSKLERRKKTPTPTRTTVYPDSFPGAGFER